MKVRVALIAAWLIMGQLIVGGLYWQFLSTPESNTVMLSISAALVIVMILVAGLTIGSAIMTSASSSISRGVWGAPWIVVAIIPALVIWWIVARADAWLAAHSGEVAAWFIARLGWADVSWLMRSLDYLSLWLRAVVAPLLGLALFAALLFRGRAALGQLWWIGRALRPSTLLVSTVAFALLIALPLQVVYWQPPGLPDTWVQPAAAATRLLLIALAGTIGWAVMIAMVADRAAVPPPPAVPHVPASNPPETSEITLD